jgi:hypothetical protein
MILGAQLMKYPRHAVQVKRQNPLADEISSTDEPSMSSGN